jgi:3',5'-cyclic AMP phosphodiesterase CpdA
MKTIFVKSLIAILILAVLASVGFAVVVATRTEEEALPVDRGMPVVRFVRPEGETPYLIKTYSDGTWCSEPFKIVTFTDPHFSGFAEMPGDAVSLKLIENTIKYEHPDLVVLTGDIAVGWASRLAATNIGDLFERYQQYWGFVLGNHDGENELGVSRKEMVEIFCSYEHCVVSEGPENVWGNGNSIVNVIKGDGEVLQSLVFIDSGDHLKKEFCEAYGFEYTEGYDFIKYDQIEWYKSEMRAIAARNGNKMPDSIMFLHIPLKEYRIAYDLACQNGTVLSGERREAECDSPYNTGMFDAILEIGSTKAVVCGHDHINDYIVEYQGVKLLYSCSTSFNSYYMRKRESIYYILYKMGADIPFSDGHTLFEVDKNGKTTITPIYNQNNPRLLEGLTREQLEAVNFSETMPQ